MGRVNTSQSASLAQLVEWLHQFGSLVQQNKGYLTELDSAIGDADHGANMARGMNAVLNELPETSGADALFKKVGMTLVSSVGGASGPLYGTFFMRFATPLGSGDEVSAESVAAALRAGLEGVLSRGKAELGDKTMVDAMTPAVEAIEAAVSSGESLAEATRAGAAAAREGREATIEMVARKGRASYLGERSKGHQDPGATSTAYLFEALAASLDGA
ncbi:MAG: dihydroxyacetone kinase subunit DhaL [Propionibacteriaceae bacterium]|nr:dihydroxyacetone kinase subunit DhaL [Propionibacteriaceae bacterium]